MRTWVLEVPSAIKLRRMIYKNCTFFLIVRLRSFQVTLPRAQRIYSIILSDCLKLKKN